MLRFAVGGMAVVILVLAGVVGFVACGEDGGGGGTVQPTGWEAVSYKDKHDICHDWAGGNDYKYQPCMQCGPDEVVCQSIFSCQCKQS